MPRFIVIVLDGFGVGAMADVAKVRPQDQNANTAYHLFDEFSSQRLPILEQLGVNNIVQCPTSIMVQNALATFGKINLYHQGCDSFAGHQELMGQKPVPPHQKPFSYYINTIENALKNAGYSVVRIEKQHLQCLLVEQGIIIGDNLEAEFGLIYSINANLNVVDYDKALNIAKIVRTHNIASRNVLATNYFSSMQRLIDAIEVQDQHIGINAVQLNMYKQGYRVTNLGLVNQHSQQVPNLLHTQQIPTILIGKVAEIVTNPHGVNRCDCLTVNDTFNHYYQLSKQYLNSFFCINIQSTDLAGHQQDPQQYWSELQLIDQNLKQLISTMTPYDKLIITADHGNDPYISHRQHTREQVPLMIHPSKNTSVNLEVRESLADIGATVCDFFGVSRPEFGTSFLKNIQ